MAEANVVEPVVVCWSGGKDSAMALGAVLGDPALRVASLLTVITADYDRVSLHGVRRSLLDRQAEALGLPLEVVSLAAGASEAEYEEAMRRLLERYKGQGVSRCVFGDLFLREVRERRERNLAKVGMSGLFPLWGRDSGDLAREFIARGFRAILVNVEARRLDASFCGREFDGALLRDLAPDVDPCGENGEFHTFVYDGPAFRRPVAVVRGTVVQRGGFWYCDLVPAGETGEVLCRAGGS